MVNFTLLEKHFSISNCLNIEVKTTFLFWESLKNKFNLK